MGSSGSTEKKQRLENISDNDPPPSVFRASAPKQPTITTQKHVPQQPKEAEMEVKKQHAKSAEAAEKQALAKPQQSGKAETDVELAQPCEKQSLAKPLQPGKAETEVELAQSGENQSLAKPQPSGKAETGIKLAQSDEKQSLAKPQQSGKSETEVELAQSGENQSLAKPQKSDKAETGVELAQSDENHSLAKPQQSGKAETEVELAQSDKKQSLAKPLQSGKAETDVELAEAGEKQSLVKPQQLAKAETDVKLKEVCEKQSLAKPQQSDKAEFEVELAGAGEKQTLAKQYDLMPPLELGLGLRRETPISIRETPSPVREKRVNAMLETKTNKKDKFESKTDISVGVTTLNDETTQDEKTLYIEHKSNVENSQELIDDKKHVVITPLLLSEAESEALDLTPKTPTPSEETSKSMAESTVTLDKMLTGKPNPTPKTPSDIGQGHIEHEDEARKSPLVSDKLQTTTDNLTPKRIEQSDNQDQITHFKTEVQLEIPHIKPDVDTPVLKQANQETLPQSTTDPMDKKSVSGSTAENGAFPHQDTTQSNADEGKDSDQQLTNGSIQNIIEEKQGNTNIDAKSIPITEDIVKLFGHDTVERDGNIQLKQQNKEDGNDSNNVEKGTIKEQMMRDPRVGSPHATKHVLTIEEIDKRARKAPPSLKKSFDDLIVYLSAGLENTVRPEVYKARGILVWLSTQTVDKEASGPSSEDTPEEFLTLLGKSETTFSRFFQVLCRKADIECEVVEGFCKAGDYQPGDSVEEQKTVWNAIYVENDWHPVQTFWACRCIVGKKDGGWIKIEAGGKAVGEKVQSSAGVVMNTFQEYYFMQNPEEFIYSCCPFEKKWQLIETPITVEEFQEMPYVYPEFFNLGLRLSTSKCHLKSKKGRVTIRLFAPTENAKSVEMWYELYLKDTTGDRDGKTNELLNPQTMPRLVAMIRCGEKWEFQVQLPVEGTYKLTLHGGMYKEGLEMISEFRIDCDEPVKECVPLPIDPGRTGFGPGPKAEEAGFKCPSHRNGIYSIRKNVPMTVRFILDGDAADRGNIKASLKMVTKKNGKFENVSLDQCVETHIDDETNELKLVTTVKGSGEYALSISTNIESSEEPDSFDAVCNYIFSSQRSLPSENRAQDKARSQLQNDIQLADLSHHILAENQIRTLRFAIQRCVQEDIPVDDEDIEVANNTIQQILKINGIGVKLLIEHVLASDMMKQIQRQRKHLESEYRKRVRQEKMAIGEERRANLLSGQASEASLYSENITDMSTFNY